MRNYLPIKTKTNYFSMTFFVFIIFLGFLFFPFTVKAQVSIQVSDQSVLKAIQNAIKGNKEDTEEQTGDLKDDTKFWEKLKESGSKALSSTLRNALNKIAYDTATYIGSGGRGQKPLFITEDWGTYLGNIADSAAGEFLEALGRDPNFFGRFNLCEPDINVKITIGLGLVRQQRPREPVCTFTKMKKNWEQELTRDDFLYRFSNMFTPGGNDLSIAFGIHSNLLGDIQAKATLAEKDRTETQGWRPIKNLAGDKQGPPGTEERELSFVNDLRAGNFGKFTGDALVDASNVFLNQLAITAFQTAMRKLADRDGSRSTSPYDWSSLTLFESGPRNTGIAGTKERLNTIIEPKFNVRGDYNILSELTMCPDPTKAGPTNCVITDRFKDAVSEVLTVGEAMKMGYLKRNGVFGFRADGVEPFYNEGYPYRSMIILRKFRILPLNWEIAAQHIKENANKTYSLGDLVNCFDASDDYAGFYEPWCDGLIDPNWVLKAPLNYCKREGPGPEIMSERITGIGENAKLSIARNNNYCADEQSCIDENYDGSCNIYGYCTEERRGWSFGTSSCEPKYNTCQTFVANNGSKISYLENTLDYSGCNAGNAGCSEYFMEASSFDSSTNNVLWNTSGNVIYLDNDASECSPNNDGCTQLIRTKAGTGANLLPNSSFEDFDFGSGDFQYWGSLGTAESDPFDGYVSMGLSGNSSFYVNVGPTDHDAKGEDFSLSIYAKNCGYNSYFGIGEGIIPGSGIATSSLGTTEDWAYYAVAKTMPLNYISNQIEIIFNIDSSATDCVVDAIKLERGASPSRYSAYMSAGTIYQKLIPEYMHDSCYIGAGNYELKANRPLECNTYSRLCMYDEVGCNMYTSVKDKISVPAKVSSQDYCPDICVGYEAYLQSGTSFDSPQYQYFIPNTAKTCSAQAVGCDEFTNLDLVDQGGEAREYYTSLKHCIKPADPLANCGEYYSWEGSKETGYRLKVYSLQNGASGPDVTSDDSLLCSRDIHYANSSSPLYNPDCREYYAKDGQVYYNLNSRVITCSENCHPYRRTDDNVVRQADGSNYSQTACLGMGLNYDTNQNYCVECINGGVWNSQHNACIYMAVPAEGQTCAAAQAGCREYGGNTGRNTRIILNNNFEGGTQNWQAEGATNVTTSNEALMVGGSSLYVSGAPHETYLSIGTRVASGNAYVVSFLAKGDGNIVDLNFRFENSNEISSYFSQPVTLNASEWGIYEINLLVLDHEVDAGERLVISANNNFYIDDIRLTSIGDRYYLIKNSWVMPEINGRDICNWDIVNDGPYPLYSLSCQQYTDKENKPYSLRRFTNLCQESAVGCEVMIDTHNSNYYGQEDIPFASANPSLPDVVPADNYIYAVYNAKNLCDSVDKGCQRLGKSTVYEGQILTQDFYLRNNPDQYDTIVCSQNAVTCDQWSTNEGLAYFKNPGDQICEWRQVPPTPVNTGQIDIWGWYKKKVKRCDINDNGIIETGENTVCNNNLDCSVVGGNCILDETDHKCITSETKTFGFGGSGKVVSQPVADSNGYWAGTCPTAQSGCTEYIDPVSSFETNLIFNSNFTQNISGSGSPADGWAGGYQEISLKPYTLYILASDNNRVELRPSPTTPTTLFELTAENTVMTATMPLVADGNIERASIRFFTGPNTNIRVRVSANNVSANNNSTVELKRAAIDYQIKTGMDRNSCNGQVSFADGCVLFNEREISKNTSGAYASLIWNADATADTGFTGFPASGDNSNALINVRPDRKCNEWLACKSYIKNSESNNVCYDIGLCDSLDDNGSCNNFVVGNTAPVNQIYSSGSVDFSDKSGYYKASHVMAVNSFEKPNDYFKFEEMTQIGGKLDITNGNFETYSSDGYPISWSNTAGEVWDKNKYKIVKSPVEMQEEGIGYAPEGSAYLKTGSGYELVSGFIDISPGSQYILSAHINTLKMSQGSAEVVVLQYSSSSVDPISTSIVASQQAGKSWNFVVGELNTSSSASKIKILLRSTGGADGNYYYDDIKIKPALNSRSNWFTPQECRLFPDTNSLACEYIEDSGAQQKGWFGYCLEYDRYPGNSSACLLWWPVNNVKGDGDVDKDDYGGYVGKTPVYYCDHIDANFVLVERRKRVYLGMKKSSKFIVWTYSSSNSYTAGQCPDENAGVRNGGYKLTTTTSVSRSLGGLKKKTTTLFYCDPIGPRIAVGPEGGSWYEYNGNLVAFTGADDGGHNEARYGVKVYDETTQAFVGTNDYEIKCNKIHQTVTPDGQNKAWSGRVFAGSDYFIPTLSPTPGFEKLYDFSSDEAPFGSIVPPNPVHNPYEWDGSSLPGNQPLALKSKSTNQVRVGSPYDCIGESNCPNIGYCSISTDNICLYVEQNRILAPNINDYPECDIDQIAPCYTNWKQDLLPCPSGEFCNSNLFNADLPSVPQPIDNLQRIFAKNYGTWVWSGSKGFCANNPGVACDGIGNQCPYGTCQRACQLTLDGQRIYQGEVEEGEVAMLTIPDTCSSNAECESGTKLDGLSLSQFNTQNTCQPYNNVCISGGIDVCIEENCCDPAIDEDCTAADSAECLAYYNDLSTSNICAVSLDSCSATNPCPSATSECHYDYCVGGTNNGSSCSDRHICTNNYCQINDTNAGRYVPSDDPSDSWDVPTSVCPGATRPPAFAPNDYCAIVPRVDYMAVNKKPSGNIEIKNGEIAHLQFTSVLDKQQTPLVAYTIYWDGGNNPIYSSTYVSGIKMNPRPSSDNPHSAFHLYGYWDLLQKSQNASSPVQCFNNCTSDCVSGYTGPYCRVKPQIQIKDNWGWCNGGVTGNPCPPNSYTPFSGYIVVTQETAN